MGIKKVKTMEYKHDEKNPFKALGIKDKDFKDSFSRFMKIFNTLADREASTLSETVEEFEKTLMNDTTLRRLYLMKTIQFFEDMIEVMLEAGSEAIQDLLDESGSCDGCEKEEECRDKKKDNKKETTEGKILH